MYILIIEDDKKIADYTKLGFEDENFIVDVVYNGEDGLKCVEEKTYDAIILDWMLPGIDGIEVCKTIRSGGITTPILMLTAKIFIEDRVMSLNSGADDYIAKPFYFEELLARVNAQMRRVTYVSNPIINIDDLSVNIQTREVKRTGHLIDLTPKEYGILELLIKNRGHVVKIKTIMEEVWQGDTSVTSNIINVYMHHLRHKIDSANKKALIKTVRKQGFRLERS